MSLHPIQQYRLKMNYTQRKFENLAGITGVSGWEKGKHLLSLATLKILKKRLPKGKELVMAIEKYQSKIPPKVFVKNPLKVGNPLYDFRAGKLTLAQVAKKIGVHADSIYKFEKGRLPVSIKTFHKIAELLGVDYTVVEKQYLIWQENLRRKVAR